MTTLNDSSPIVISFALAFIFEAPPHETNDAMHPGTMVPLKQNHSRCVPLLSQFGDVSVWDERHKNKLQSNQAPVLFSDLSSAQDFPGTGFLSL